MGQAIADALFGPGPRNVSHGRPTQLLEYNEIIMLYTYVHHKEYSNVSQDVAHFYEHLVIFSFHSYLESLGIHPGLIGSVNGDMFEHIVFLNATFYEKKVADAYEHFLTSPELIDTSLISQMLVECETEDRVTFIMHDEVEFNRQLDSLIEMPWVSNDSATAHFVDESSTAKAVLEAKQSAKEFRDIALGFYADSDALDQDEQTLFLRLSVIVGDILELTIRRRLHGAYCIDRTPIAKDNAIMGSIHHIRFRRGVSLKSIKKAAEGALQTIDIQSGMPFITAQFEEFADRTTWKSFVIDYYRHTGILTNVEYISSLATPKRIVSVLSKLKIHVRAMQKSDEEWFSY